MEYVDIISRIVHVATAITLVGGSVFTLFVLIPSASELPDQAHQQLSASIKQRWKRFVHIGVLLFLVSGFYNYIRMIPAHQGDGLYHGLVGTKILLAFGVFFLAAALVGRSEKLEGFRRNRKKWLSVLVLLTAVIVAISGYVKVRGVLPSTEVSQTDPQL
jgi:uncharacterized membrane protein